MALPDYDGKVIGSYRHWEITECEIRPKGMRFGASPVEQDGTIATLFAACIEDLHAEIDDWYLEHDDDCEDWQIDECFDGRR